MALATKIICIYAEKLAAEDVDAEFDYRDDYGELADIELYSLHLGGAVLNRTQAIEMFGRDEVERVEAEFCWDDVSSWGAAA